MKRGEAEGWIKDFERALEADRPSRHRLFADRFRLSSRAAAYRLSGTLRGRLVARGVRRMRLDTPRLRFIEIGGRGVRRLLTKVRL